MKKKILPFGLALCGLAALVASCGVLATLGGSEVDANSEDSYSLVTSGKFSENTTYIMTSGTSGSVYVMGTNLRSDKFDGVSTSVSGGKITGANNFNYVQFFQVSGSSTYWNIWSTNYNNGAWIGWSSGTDLATNTGTTCPTSNKYQWTVSLDNTGKLTIRNVNTDSRYFGYYSSGNRYGPYASAITSYLWKASTPAIAGITVDTTSAKTEYFENEGWDFSGLSAVVSYEDGSSETINSNSSNWSDVTWKVYDSSTGGNVIDAPAGPGTVYVEATYAEVASTRAELAVTYTARNITGISVDVTNAKVTYQLGDSFDTTGLVITLNYDIGDSVVLSSLDGVAFALSDGTELVPGSTIFDTSGTLSVVVTYTDGSAFRDTYEIKVFNAVRDSTTFISNSSELDGIKASSSSNEKAEWTSSHVTMTQTKGGNNNVNLTYPEIRVYSQHSLTISPNDENTTISSIEYTYSEKGPSWYPNTGTEIKEGNIYTFTLNRGVTEAKITSNNAQTRFDYIKVNWSYLMPDFGTLDHIEVSTPPTKSAYMDGETFDASGLAITAYDAEGNSKVVTEGFSVDLQDYVFTREDVLAGSKTGIVTYEGKTAEFTVTVTEAPAYEYAFASTDKAFESSSTFKASGLAWTASLTGGVVSTYDGNKGLHFGTISNPCSYVSIRSELFNAGKLIDRVIVNTSGSSDNNGYATVSVKVGTTVVDTKTITDTATDYEFNLSALTSGHIEIYFDNYNEASGSAYKAGLYLKSIAFYGEDDASGIAALAAEIEAFDSCNFTAEAKSALVAKYQAVTGEAKTALDAIELDDKADQSQTIVFNRCTVAEKMAAIQARTADSSTSPEALSVFGSGSDWMIMGITVGLSLFVIGASLILIKRSRHT